MDSPGPAYTVHPALGKQLVSEAGISLCLRMNNRSSDEILLSSKQQVPRLSFGACPSCTCAVWFCSEPPNLEGRRCAVLCRAALCLLQLSTRKSAGAFVMPRGDRFTDNDVREAAGKVGWLTGQGKAGYASTLDCPAPRHKLHPRCRRLAGWSRLVGRWRSV